MDAKQFFYMVSEMRRCQKEYFRTRAQSALRLARYYEKCIDFEINKVNNLLNQNLNNECTQ